MNPIQLSVSFLNLFIISFPLSVTLSQTFAILSIFFFLFGSFQSKNLLSILRNQTFVAAIAIYIALLPSFFLHLFDYQVSIFTVPFKSELSDFWMCLLILPAFYHIRQSEYRISILRSIYISTFLTVLTGFISIFTPFRLAPYITAGFKVKDGVRLQHFAGDLWGRFTYLPIGLMNTHLTFGGLCGLAFPGLSVHLLMKFKDWKVWKNFLLAIFLIIFAVVIFYNQSRSIWLGILFAFGLIGIKLIQNSKIKLVNWKYLILGFGILSIVAAMSISIYKKNWLLQRAFQEGLSDNTTENQRYFIYKNTLSLNREHWLMGVGPGRFDLVHKEKSNLMIKENEQLWYELFITPRQHAHHDLLHFYSIGGLLGLAALLHFWFYLFRLFLKNPLTSETVLFGGVLAIFIAGFFQCYFLDDEVTLPFFAMVGLFAGSLQKEDSRIRGLAESRIRKNKFSTDSFLVESISLGSSFLYLRRHLAIGNWSISFNRINFYSTLVLVIPIILSFSYILFKTRFEPMQVYKRKVTLNYPEDRALIFRALKGEQVLYPTNHTNEQDTIRIEGCLSHRFTNPITIRKDLFQIIFLLSENSKNPPTEVKVKVIERDSFDQDQLYKVHKTKQIGGEYIFPIYPNQKSLLKFDDPDIYNLLIDSKQFPENIFFRDFEFTFSGFDRTQEYFDLPAIHFGKLCNHD